MGQAKLRRRLLQAAACNPVPEGGLSLLWRRDFISVVLAVRRDDGAAVHAGLFCLDDLRDGLFRCWGKTYASADEFQVDFRAHGAQFRLVPLGDCQRRVALGLRVRDRAGASVPAEFSRWSFLLGPLGTVPLPEATYLCPACESPLPPEICLSILSCVEGRIDCYMICPECIRLKRSYLPAETAAVRHGAMRDLFESMDSFSLIFEDHP